MGTSNGTEHKVLNRASWEKAAAAWGGGGIQHGPFTPAASFNPSYSHVGGHSLPCFTQDVMSRRLVTLWNFFERSLQESVPEIKRILPCICTILHVTRIFGLFYPDLMRTPWNGPAGYCYDRFMMNTVEVRMLGVPTLGLVIGHNSHSLWEISPDKCPRPFREDNWVTLVMYIKKYLFRVRFTYNFYQSLQVPKNLIPVHLSTCHSSCSLCSLVWPPFWSLTIYQILHHWLFPLPGLLSSRALCGGPILMPQAKGDLFRLLLPCYLKWLSSLFSLVYHPAYFLDYTAQLAIIWLICYVLSPCFLH